MVSSCFRYLRGPEILFCLYGAYLGTMFSVQPPYVLNKICENYFQDADYDRTNCYGSLNSTMKATVEGQNSKYQVVMQLAAAVPAVFSAILMATWSDEHGRKMPLLFAITSTVLNSFVWILSSGDSALSIHLILLAQILSGICGHCVIMSLCFAMITDVVKEPSLLSIRMGLACSSLTLGYLCATLVCGVLDGPYEYRFLIGCCVQVFAFFYAIMVVQETYVTNDQHSYSTMETLQQLFNVQRYKDYASVMCKDRQDSSRTFLLAGLTIFFMLFICDQGMPNLQFLFVRLPPLNFTDSKYARMLTTSVASAAVSCTVLPILAKRFRFSDSSMILFAILIAICRMILFAISSDAYMVYLSAALSGVSSIYFPAFRSYLSHFVEEHETARLFATLALMEQIGPLFSSLIFNYVYAAMVIIYPGFVFLISAAVQFGLLCAMIRMHWNQRKIAVQQRLLADNPPSGPAYT